MWARDQGPRRQLAEITKTTLLIGVCGQIRPLGTASIGCRERKDEQRERCIHSIETDGLAKPGHQREAQRESARRDETIQKKKGRSSRKGREVSGQRLRVEAEVTLERARKNIGSRVVRTVMREIASPRALAHATPVKGREGRRADYPALVRFMESACSPSSDLSSLSNGGAPNLSLAVNRPPELLKISLSITSPAFWPHFPAPPSVGGE